MTTENLSTLKIHELTLEQYRRALAAGNIDENALYFVCGEVYVDGDVAIDETLTIDGAAADAKATGDALAKKAAKPLYIYADNAPNTGANSASGIPIFTIDYSPSDLKEYADAGGSVTIVRYNRHYLMYEVTETAARFRFIEASDVQVDWYNAVLDENKNVTITKTTHKSRLETTTGGAVGQVPIIKGLNSNGLPTTWEFGSFAPSGYGLGQTVLAIISSLEELDNALNTGWYYLQAVGTTLNGIAFNYANVFVCMNGDNGYQEIRPIETNYVLRRFRYNSSFKEWVCENPPMNPGVEYRTTELCENRPVYAKRVKYTITETIGNPSENVDTSIAHDISNFDYIVRCSGRKGLYVIPENGATGGSVSVLQVTTNAIVLRLYKDTLSAGDLYIDLYYTKTS